MQESFYKKIEKLQEKLSNCETREEMRQVVQSFDIDLFVSYNTNSFFSFTESLRDDQSSGSLSFTVETKITSGNLKARGRSTTFYINGPELSKKEVERKYTQTIIQTLQHLDFEEEEND